MFRAVNDHFITTDQCPRTSCLQILTNHKLQQSLVYNGCFITYEIHNDTLIDTKILTSICITVYKLFFFIKLLKNWLVVYSRLINQLKSIVSF